MEKKNNVTPSLYNTCTLANGLRVIHRHTDSAVVYCGYAVNAGTRDELPGEEGMAHFCEHLTFKGTARRTPVQIMNTLERVGGDLNAFTNKEDTVFHAAVLAEHTPRAVDLLTDIVFASTYPQAEMDKEVEVVCDEIEMNNDSPADLIYDEMENLLFAHHALGHNILGEAQQLHTYTTAQIRTFVDRLYRPDNAIFFAYGDTSFARLVAALCRAFGTKVQSEGPAKPIFCPPRVAPGAYTPQQVVKKMGTHQCHVMLANRSYAVGHERRIALYLLNNLLGGPAMSSRLNLSLRERHALVYSVESFMTSYGDTGVWGIYYGCDAHDTRRCMHLALKEIERLTAKPLSDAALNAAKRQIKGQIGVASDSREAFALDMAKAYLHYGVLKDTRRLFEQIDALTPTDLLVAARDIIAPQHLTHLMLK